MGSKQKKTKSLNIVNLVGNDTLAFNHSSVYLLLFGLVIDIIDCLNIEDAGIL